MRAAGVVTAKGSNIVSLAVGPDKQQKGVSCMIVVVDLEQRHQRRIVNEMNRLVNVLLALDVTPILADSPETPVRRLVLWDRRREQSALPANAV